MHKINISATHASDAITWATKHAKKGFDLQFSFVDSRYTFEFNDSKEATIFALKWK